MNKSLTIFCILLAALPGISRAQGTVNDLGTDFGARFSVSADKKIVKGFHWIVEGEARMDENLGNFGRWQTGTGLTWKASQYLKLGAGYTFIQKKNSSGEWNPRHRVYGDAMLTLRAGDWRFSLKERLQLTHREVNNPYQSTPDLLGLKSRFKVSYKGSNTLTPYGYLELRNVFNDPACTATWSTSSMAYTDYVFKGYSDSYFNRLRGSLGTEWNLGRNSALDIFLLADWCYDKNIDTNAKGTKLKSLTYDRKFNAGIGIGYTFSF